MADIINQISSDSKLVKLLGDYQKSFVGFVYGMRFDEVLVLTNDEWKHTVDGLPHNSFLVAAGFDPNQLASANPIDQEVVLLRILEPVRYHRRETWFAPTLNTTSAGRLKKSCQVTSMTAWTL